MKYKYKIDRIIFSSFFYSSIYRSEEWLFFKNFLAMTHAEQYPICCQYRSTINNVSCHVMSAVNIGSKEVTLPACCQYRSTITASLTTWLNFYFRTEVMSYFFHNYDFISSNFEIYNHLCKAASDRCKAMSLK